jgi:hypothetical protein
VKNPRLQSRRLIRVIASSQKDVLDALKQLTDFFDAVTRQLDKDAMR